MNGRRFDDLARACSARTTSRRTLLRTLAVGAITALVPPTQRDAIAQEAWQCALVHSESTSLSAASPGSNGEATCRVVPRAGYARVIPDGTPQASLIAANEATPVASRAVFPSLTEDQLPTGEAASEAVVAAIRATIEQVAACASPSGPGIVPATGEPAIVATPVGTPPGGLPVADLGVDPVLVLYSDDYFRRDGVVTTGGISYWAPPAPGPLTVRGVRVLDDARIGAIVEGAGAPVFLVFAVADGVFVIDEVVVLTRVEGTPAS